MKHTVNQNTESLTMTPTSFLKETCFLVMPGQVRWNYGWSTKTAATEALSLNSFFLRLSYKCFKWEGLSKKYGILMHVKCNGPFVMQL